MLHALLTFVGLAGCALAASGASRQASQFDFDVGAGDWFGWSIAEIGDQTGDGVPELAVGSPDSYDSTELSRVWVFDGASGAVVAELGTSDAEDHVGGWIANAGDVDRDGRDDRLFLASKNCVELWSLAHGRLFEFASPTWHASVGPMLGCPGDVDLDGVPDVLIGARLHSGCDGRVLRQYDAALGQPRALDSVSIVPDVDGDGISDLAFVALDVDCTRVVGISTSDGSELFRSPPLAQPQPNFELEQDGTYRRIETGQKRLQVRVVPRVEDDFDGDGECELLLHTSRGSWGPRYVETLPLQLGRDSIPIEAGIGGLAVLWVGPSSSGFRADAILGTDMFATVRRIELPTGLFRWETTLDDFAGHRGWGPVETVCQITDVDGDGERDLACGALQTESPGLPGYVNIVSGRDGVILRTLCTRDALLQVGKRR